MLARANMIAQMTAQLTTEHGGIDTWPEFKQLIEATEAGNTDEARRLLDMIQAQIHGAADRGNLSKP